MKHNIFNTAMAAILSLGMMGAITTPVFAEDAEPDYAELDDHSTATNDKISGLDATTDHNGSLSSGTSTETGHAPSSSKSAETLYQVSEGYTWTIHSLVDFGDDAGINSTPTVTKDSAIKVTRNIIPDGTKLSITLAEGNDYQVHNGNTALSYEVFNASDASGTAMAPKAEVMKVVAGTNTGSTPLTFKLKTSTTTSEVAGDYTGTIGYVASIVANS